MQANALLKHNIDTLLQKRGEKRKDLAEYCYRTESWISKIFRSDTREIPLKYLDRIAGYFGLLPHELFRPGISALTERRLGIERRAVKERRIGHAQQKLRETQAEVERVRPASQVEDPVFEHLRRHPALKQAVAALLVSHQSAPKTRAAAAGRDTASVKRS
jgi:transcriptional regulator with XRE-family HTH domain